MKVRQGFVSNSSSSSFVVAFPKGFVPTEESVKELLFGQTENLYCYGEGVSTAAAASVIANDMKNQTPNVHENIIGAMGGHLPGAPDYDSFLIPEPGKSKWELKCDWEAYEKANQEFREKMLENMKAEFGDADIYCFEFSDNDGNLYSTLEHGDTFSALPHLRVSNH